MRATAERCSSSPQSAVTISPVEERAINVFAAWLIAHIGDDAAAAGVASLVDRFKAELPDDWRSRAEEVEGVEGE